MSDVLGNSITYIKGVGPKLAQVLHKKGIDTLEDALYFVPRLYEDRRRIIPIASLQPNTTATISGKVVSAKEVGFTRYQKRFEVTLADATGRTVLTWFRAYPSLKEEFKVGTSFLVNGEVKLYRGLSQITHPDYEKIEEFVDGKPKASINFGRIVPVYSETEGLHQKTIRKIMGEVVRTSVKELHDVLPEEMRARLELPTLRQSFVDLHFPKTLPEEGLPLDALKRIIFEEFFVLQLGLGLRKRETQKKTAPALVNKNGALEKYIAGLPFSLTGDQKKVIEQVNHDIARPLMMTRLVQGDVGSGKTAVAFAAVSVTASSGYQTAIMAPTELLAIQHAKSAAALLPDLKVALLTHSTAKDKELHKTIHSGEVSLVIGTHALFQENVKFKKLGLVIVDEQHRFGVEQRADLLKKSEKENAHLLMMTATPIPRTLALTLYGDLDLSIIREKPQNRKKVNTTILKDRDLPRVYQKINETVARGEQVYIIYPLIEASEKLELKSATEMYEKLRKEIFPTLKLALLHGRMKGQEKEDILKAFKNREFDILVSTTVIEVGIDVPNSTLMVIEHPERLGLSQLHQLRGRVGRGDKQSTCLLVVDKFVLPRLRVMETSDDGFVIAEEDLKFRGPGEFLGTRQSGLPGFRVGHILRDASLLELARSEAEAILLKDPTLDLKENSGIRKMVETRWKQKIERLRGG